MIDGVPYDHNFHRRTPSGQSSGGVDVGAPAPLNTSAGTPPPPRQPSGPTPKRAHSVGLFNSCRTIPESSRTSSPAATALGTPVNQDHSRPSSFAGAATASQMFQMYNSGGMQRGGSTTLVMNMANLSVNTPLSVAQDSLQSTLGMQGGNSINYSPLDHHGMPPAAFANARPLSLPPGPRSNLAFSEDNASGGSNANQSHNKMDPKLLTDDVRGASQQQTQVNDNNAHDSRSNSLNDSMPAVGNHGAGEQQQVVTADMLVEVCSCSLHLSHSHPTMPWLRLYRGEESDVWSPFALFKKSSPIGLILAGSRAKMGPAKKPDPQMNLEKA